MHVYKSESIYRDELIMIMTLDNIYNDLTIDFKRGRLKTKCTNCLTQPSMLWNSS